MIDLISRTYWPATTGGAEKYMYELKKHVKRKFKVYTWNKSKDPDVVTVNTPKVKLMGSMIFSYKASQLINKSSSKLVHISQYWSEYSSYFLKKPFISTIYDLPTNPLHKVIVKHCALKSKKICYISDMVKQELMKLGVAEQDLIYTPPGIDDSIRKPRKVKKHKEKIFLHISRLAPNKDLITIIKALGQLKNQLNFKFYIAGQKMEWTDYYQQVIKEVRKQKLQRRVKFLGRVSEKKKLDLLHSADAYLHASTHGEGFGIPIVEAQAAGVPVITTRLFSDIGIVRHDWNGLIFPYHDSELLSQHILKVINDQQYAKRLIKNGLKFSKKFNWAKTFKPLIKVYEDYK